jgi:hypothetical protein
MATFLQICDHQIGDLIFIANKNWFFDYLRGVAKARFDHVGMFIDVDKYIEAVPFGGVHIKDYSNVWQQDHSIVRLKDETKIPKMIEYCLKQEGKKYDFLQAVCVYFLVLFRITRTLNPVEIGSAFVCTELIGQAANYAGFKFVENINADRLLPDDIYNSDKVIKI